MREPTVIDTAPSAMNPLEAMMWRAESDPRLRSPITIVDVLDGEPDHERLVAAHEWATRVVPRLRQRVVEPYWGWGTPEWVTDPDFTLDVHLRHHRTAPGGGLRELFDLAAVTAMTPFDRERPPWEATLVTGLADGRAGYVLKVHHSLADGLGLVQVLDLLHGSRRDPARDRPVHPVPEPRRLSRSELTAERVADRSRSTPRELGTALEVGARLLARAVTDPVATAGRARDLVTSALRAALPEQGPGSPLLRERSLNRRFVALDVDLAELKAAAHAAGGSLNDAYLAAVLGALRRYHAHFGRVPASIPVGMPISTRDRGDPVGGNHWAGTRFAAPLDEPDPRALIGRVRTLVRGLAEEPVLDALGLVAPVLAALPTPLLALVQGGATRANDLQVSNLPGLTRPAYLAGTRIVRSYPFAPLPGGALMVALMSHEGTCCVAANLDPAAIGDPDLFATCLDAGFADVLALGR